MVDYKALVGDTSDNIPGVAGVGPKTAVSLLDTYKTLDNIYQHLDELPGKTGDKLRNGKESAYMSQDLARIRIDVGVKLVLEEARTDHLDIPAVENLFRELEFRTLIPRLRMIAAPLKQQDSPQLSLFGQEMKEIIVPMTYSLDVKVVDTKDKLMELTKALSSSNLIAFDTETSALDPLQAEIVGISLAIKEGEGFYIPLGHKDGQPQLGIDEVISCVNPRHDEP